MNIIRQILFVINPSAGGTSKEELLEYVSSFCKEHSVFLKTHIASGGNKIRGIKSLLEKHSFDRVLVAGGDGTIHKVTEILIDYPITMGIFPEGSSNGLAHNLNIPGTKEEQLKVALSENILYLDVLKMNENLCVHIADFGVNAELIKNFEKGTVRGKLGYALKTIPTLLNTDYPFHFDIKANGNTHTKEGVLLAIANASKYGTGATINPNGKMDDGKFEVIIFKNLNILSIVKTLTDMHTLDPDFAEVISTDKAEIICRTSVPFQVDGDYYGKLKKLSVSVLKKKIAVTVPEHLK